mgnify:FL=1|jgi:dihydroceramidase
MIYVSMLITYCVLETSPRGTEPRYKLLLPTFLIAVTAFITVAYMIGKNPIFHQVAYGIIQTASTVRVIYLLTSSSSPLASKDKSSAGEVRRREARRLYSIGALTFLTGFLIWNLDNIYCSQIREMRNELRRQGLGWVAPWVNGHMWWHYLTVRINVDKLSVHD